jgi:hypothetical protein
VAAPSPIGRHIFEAAHEQLMEAIRLFDVSEHRLGPLLAHPVGSDGGPHSMGRLNRYERRGGVAETCTSWLCRIPIAQLFAWYMKLV